MIKLITSNQSNSISDRLQLCHYLWYTFFSHIQLFPENFFLLNLRSRFESSAVSGGVKYERKIKFVVGVLAFSCVCLLVCLKVARYRWRCVASVSVSIESSSVKCTFLGC